MKKEESTPKGQPSGADQTHSLQVWRAGAFIARVAAMSHVVSQDPEVLGGADVFTGTRVPVKSLFDHLEAGDSIDNFLAGFPSVRREQVKCWSRWMELGILPG